MPGATTNFAWPFPLPGDPANVAQDVQNLATAIDASVGNAWAAYVPVWTTNATPPSLGTGTLEGRYKQLGKTVFATGRLVPDGTTTFGTGFFAFTLPVTAGGGHPNMYGGAGFLFDNSTAANQTPAYVRLLSSTQIGLYGITGRVTGTVPFTWATSDQLVWNVVYEAA